MEMKKIENSNIIYVKSDNLLQDAQQIIETAQNFAYKAVNIALLQRNWLLAAPEKLLTNTLNIRIIPLLK